MNTLVTGIICLLIIQGCSPYQYRDISSTQNSKVYRSQIETSLFENDNKEITQEAVDKILNGYISIGDENIICVYKMENSNSGITKYYGYGYWNSEEYLDLEQQYFQTISDNLKDNKKVKLIKPLPTILTPKNVSLSKLRESAVRLQSKLMIIYSIQSDIFEDLNLFSANEVKAYSTCEMILYHTGTGIIPYSDVITRKIIEKQLQNDANFRETRKRAEKKAIIEAIDELSKRINNFLTNN